jgi:D-lactate dehydrogenase
VRLPPLQAPAHLPTEVGRQTGAGVPRRVLYFPTCVTRMMGPAHGDPEQRPVSDVFMELANKAGYEVIVPQVRGGRRA